MISNEEVCYFFLITILVMRKLFLPQYEIDMEWYSKKLDKGGIVANKLDKGV